MVERLTAAIEKARTSRVGQTPDSGLAPERGFNLPMSTEVDWTAIPEAVLDPIDLDDARLVTSGQDSRQAASLEILQTKLVRICRQNGWKRVAFVPTRTGCGATTLALNLAMTAARKGDLRVMLADMDFLSPSIANRLDISGAVPLREVLERVFPPERMLSRLGQNLILMTQEHALGSAEIPALDVRIRSLLQHLQSRFQPDLLFLDLPPIFAGGYPAALLADVDAAFQIASANQTTAPEIDECAEVIAGSTEYLGVILNRCSDRSHRRLADVLV